MVARDLVGQVVELFSTRIPFNRTMGFRFDTSDPECVRLRFDSRPELIGNFMRGNLHGGAIASSLDVIGGLVAFVSVLHKRGQPLTEAEVDRFANLGTIDLRIDYLRPGLGRHYVAAGFVLRTGSKVAVTRMELHDDSEQLIAVGTGAYIIR